MGHTTNSAENTVLFTLCDCKSEILVIEYDAEIKMADLAIYEVGYSFRNKMSLWQKIRYCWRVIMNNRPFGDQIVVTQAQIKEIKEFLSTLC